MRRWRTRLIGGFSRRTGSSVAFSARRPRPAPSRRRHERGRSDDPRTLQLLQRLEHAPTRAAVTAERTFLRNLEGGCQIPIGALATCTGDRIELEGFVAGVESGRLLRERTSGSVADAAGVGNALAATLRERGADELLREARELPASDLPRGSAP